VLETIHKKTVVTFGELLLRLTTKGHERFAQAESFEARYTGAEANVAVSLANWGMAALAVSKVPDHEIGQACINYLRRFGVNTDYVYRGGRRLGIVFAEIGASQRPSQIIYDRAYSCFQEADPAEFRWEEILPEKDWFHFSGTAPARGKNIVRALHNAFSVAKENGLTISCDMNYRSKLWSIEEARRVMPELMEFVDVAIIGVEDTTRIFGIPVPAAGRSNLIQDPSPLAETLAKLSKEFRFSYVAMTLRKETSASANQIRGLLSDGREMVQSSLYDIEVVDRIGGGDAFTAGLIHALLMGESLEQIIEFAAAASCLKHTIPGDFNLVSMDEVKRLVECKEFGRIQR
jgi:2-dehydro-3-deoxygluconokinase